METPIEERGRCYTAPPIPAIAPQPPGGVDRICPAPTPFEENGRCYTLTPAAASAGICTPFDVSCSLDDLISKDAARILADAVAERLPDW